MARFLPSRQFSLLVLPLLAASTLAVVTPASTALAQSLHFVQDPPLSTLAGQSFSVQVEVRDSNGDPDGSFSPNVQLTLLGGGTLSGSTSLKVESDGVARFSGLSIAQPGLRWR